VFQLKRPACSWGTRPLYKALASASGGPRPPEGSFPRRMAGLPALRDRLPHLGPRLQPGGRPRASQHDLDRGPDRHRVGHGQLARLSRGLRGDRLRPQLTGLPERHDRGTLRLALQVPAPLSPVGVLAAHPPRDAGPTPTPASSRPSAPPTTPPPSTSPASPARPRCVETLNQSSGTSTSRSWLPHRRHGSSQNFGETGPPSPPPRRGEAPARRPAAPLRLRPAPPPHHPRRLPPPLRPRRPRRPQPHLRHRRGRPQAPAPAPAVMALVV
jgi:hypothetical protein